MDPTPITLAQALKLGAKALRAQVQPLAFDANRADKLEHTDVVALRAARLVHQAQQAAALLEAKALQS